MATTTTTKVLAVLIGALCDNYAKQLHELPLTPEDRMCLLDGFRDGARAGVYHACEMLGVEVHVE